jgi:UDP-N-acetylmuramoyl-tripeptide--D-alanyl-D-alanine ligase
MDLTQIAQYLGCLDTVLPRPIGGISIDTRHMSPGDLFVALKGAHFDGHDYMVAAIEAGAAAIVCERLNASIDRSLQLLVPDTLKALATMASCHRATIACPIIAVTGSNGKTSTKEMIYSILPKPALATQGNLNNHIGAPLSVMRLETSHRYAVFELGASHLNEISYTAAVVKPQVALITNIAPAHIEGFGSIEGVARAKGEIYESLDASGTAVINEDDAFAHFWDNIVASKRVLRFSLKKPADITVSDLSYNALGHASFTLVFPQGLRAAISLQVPGEHSVYNALAAAASCFALGIAIPDIEKGLNAFHGVAGRMAYREGVNHSLVIDDTYNANLRSVLAAVAVLAKRPGFRILVLGDMGELGTYTQAHHEEIGRIAQEQGINLVMTCGQHSIATSQAFGSPGKHYQNQEELVQELLTYLDKDTTVLVKGSRSARMEKIVHKILLSSAVNTASAANAPSEQNLLSKLPLT